MTDVVAPVEPAPGHRRHAAPPVHRVRSAVIGLALRHVRRGCLVVAAVIAAMSALVVLTHRDTMAAGLDVAALAANPAIRTLFGEPTALETPGGFTVWRTGTPLAVLLAVWSVLTSTRVTRGEEDTGRWDLLLSGRLTTSDLVSCHVAVISAGGLLGGVAAVGALVSTGTPLVGAVLHGLGLGLVAVFFTGVGSVAAQVWSHRSAASGAAVAVVGVALALRMVGDGVAWLSWVRWATPFGLTALVGPYADDRVLPLLVLAVAAAAAVMVAPLLAARRDVRGGWFRSRTGRRARPRLLGSVPAFALRRLLGPLGGWAVGLAAYFLLVGLLAVSVTDFLRDNPRFAVLAEQAGMGALGQVAGYAAALFAVLALPLGVFAAVRIASVAAEETAGRLTLLLAGPVRRSTPVLAEAAATAAGVVALAVTAGVAFALGAGLVGAPLAVGAAVAGAVNLVPVALLCLGAAVAALGWWPRATVAAGAFPAVGGFLIQVLAENADAPTWVLAMSPFRYVAPVPQSGPQWVGSVIMTAIALMLVVTGTAGLSRRDLGP